ncbi:Pseudouridylate synthase 7 like protein [Habropoda laboriosa]|uniref:Pseudouridylate synthase 7 like protein n=1 Tax=Habropoda laboriosa TaxID=597456 RepID=A0A0L7R9R0_9HYME|nr:Pseudouridylate synthase 7 like protein [Habropoda laboriosa]
MSEVENKNINFDNNLKSCDSKQETSQESTRGQYKRDFRKDGRSNNDYRRNRSSYNTGFRNENFGRKPFKRNWSNSQQDGKRKKLEVGSRLKECDVGITMFIGDEGFFGVIKERYTDFHVNEISLNGQIAKLTNQNLPLDEERNENLEDLRKMISDAVWDQLQTLQKPEASTIEIDVTNIDKDQRRAIHTIVKKMPNVISQTIDKENKKIMVILPNKKNSDTYHNFRKDNRLDWKKRGGEYCYFLLHKVNMDTMDALNQLAMNLRLKPNNFNYAGTKDRRAWTTQWVCLRKVEPADILRAAKNVRGAYVGNFKFEKEPLKLGMLSGNHFRIALRNVNGTDEQIEKIMISLRDFGFINYYGLQRFGTVPAIPTYEIGKALLQGNWHEAIALILKPREGEQDKDLVNARKIYETTKDASAAYRTIKRCDKIEATLLKGLSISGNHNAQGALDSIPRNIRLMYIHAYQSFVWNHMVSRRIREFGRKPIVGDLVYENYVNQNKTTNEKDESEDLYNLPAVKVLKEEDLPKYTLADVLMPQVGWKVTYPSYAKPWFDEFLAKDGLTTDLRQKNKKYSLGGTYRQILQIPSNLSWKIMHYKEKHSDLIMCDIDEMRKNTGYIEFLNFSEGQYKALIVEVSLKSSTYATMALREILKFDTSPQAQAAQSAACNAVVENSDTSKDVTESKNAMQDENGKNDAKKCPEVQEQKVEDNEMEVSNAI